MTDPDTMSLDTMPPDTMTVFDRRVVRLHRDRAARHLADHDYLLAEVADRLAERLDLIRRDFPRALDLGGRAGAMAPRLLGRSGIGTVVRTDLSPAMAALGDGPRLAADEEFLPFADGAFDLVVSNLSLHWVNDLPGALIQVRRVLRPDGLFLATLFGGDTLFELRRCLMEAEMEATGGVSPRISPMADLRDAAGLLQRAGFALPVADCDTITVGYSSPLRLIQDLRGMGETNAALARLRCPTRRAVFQRALERYAELFTEADGTLTATFQVLYLAGWSPDAAVQQQPARRGSADTRLAEALKSIEIGTGVRPDGGKA